MQTKDDRFYTLETEERKQFYQVPKQFMDIQSKYYSMNAMTKLLYAILSDRNHLSIKNGWVDEFGRIYFYYNQDDLSDALGCSVKTVRKYLKELEKFGLLIRKRQGLSHPDFLYLLQIETEETQYNSLMGKFYPSRTAEFTHQEGKNLPPNNIEYNNTNNISSSSEDDDIKQIQNICRSYEFKLKRNTIIELLKTYSRERIIEAIKTASSTNDNIKNNKAYIKVVLENKLPVNNYKCSNRFNNFEQREYTQEEYKEIESKLTDLNYFNIT